VFPTRFHPARRQEHRTVNRLAFRRRGGAVVVAIAGGGVFISIISAFAEPPAICSPMPPVTSVGLSSTQARGPSRRRCSTALTCRPTGLTLTSVFLTTLSRLGLHPPAMQAFFRLVLPTHPLTLGLG
jgi:hypothetical protein